MMVQPKAHRQQRIVVLSGFARASVDFSQNFTRHYTVYCTNKQRESLLPCDLCDDGDKIMELDNSIAPVARNENS